MSVFIYRSLPRLSGTLSTRKSFANLSECFQLTESSENVATLELYDAFKFIASSPQQRQDAIKDDRFGHLLSNLDTRLSNLNTSYLGNFALRLVTILQSNPLLSDDKDSNSSKGKEILERICSEILQKEANVKEIAQVAFAAANAGLDTDFYDYAKQQMTLNIENANADSLNLAILTAYKRSMRDKAYLALLCEKLSELTDRFTATDVVSTLRSLAKTGLLKGFLLRRLSTLVHDNLDQFSEVQLAQATYRLALLKFQTPSQFATIYKAIEPKISTLPLHFQVEVLTAGCLSRSCAGGQHEALVSLAKSIEPQKDWDMITLINYIYSCVCLKVYDKDRLGAALTSLLAKSPFVLRKYALLFKEAYNALVLESPKNAPKLPDAWKQALDNFETAELDYVKQVPIFAESERILKGSSGNFESFVKIDPFIVAFADLNRKLVILAENGNILGSLDLTERNLKNMGYKVAMIKYWEWRRLKTEASQADYIAKVLQSLTK